MSNKVVDVMFECLGNRKGLASAFNPVQPLGVIAAVGLDGDGSILLMPAPSFSALNPYHIP